MKLILFLSSLFVVALAAPNKHHQLYLAKSTRKTSINWSGAVVQGTNLTGATATFPVLDPKIPVVNETGKDAYLGSVWIGIDGYNSTACPEGLWQAGVMTQHTTWNGLITFQAWYEWYPDPPVFMDIGNISSGDIIKVALDAPSPTQASVILENQSTGRGFNATVNLTSPLCFSSVEWIVERSYSLSGLIGLVDFGTETIDNITYTEAGMIRPSIPNDVVISDIIDDELDDVQQTFTEIGEDSINITYIGS